MRGTPEDCLGHVINSRYLHVYVATDSSLRVRIKEFPLEKWLLLLLLIVINDLKTRQIETDEITANMFFFITELKNWSAGDLFHIYKAKHFIVSLSGGRPPSRFLRLTAVYDILDKVCICY